MARPPLAIRVAVIGLWVLVALMVLDLIGLVIGGGFVVGMVLDVVLAVVFGVLATAVRQARAWSRWTAVGFCALLLLTSIAQLTQSLPPIVLVVAGVQFAVLAAVVGCLVPSTSRAWFRPS